MHSKTSLLTALRKYRPRDASDPLENFVTEAFAWLLSNHPDFGRFVLLQITTALNSGLIPEEAIVTWSTQVNLGGKFPDLVCIAGDTAFIFEHKVWSGLGESQLDNYRAHATARFGMCRFKVILITAGPHQHAQRPDLAICWRDVYHWIKTWMVQSGNDHEFLFQDFCTLLEDEGLGPHAPVSHEAILAFRPSRNFEYRVSQLVNRVSKHPWVKVLPSGAARVEPHEAGLWGRTGFYLLGKNEEHWFPGLFVGFMLDEKDHSLTWMNPSNPDFSIIISFHSFRYPGYESHPLYVKMVAEVSAGVENLGTGFKFYHHLYEPALSEGPNRWHPIHIRKPMLDLLRGTKTAEDQERRVIEQTSPIIEIIAQCSAFWELREELRKVTSVTVPAPSSIS